MTDLSAFPVTRKWPAKHPERLQLYSLPTPNGVKVSIMLEEIGLAYEAHKVSFDNDDQLSLNLSRSAPTTRYRPSWTPTARAGSRCRCLSQGPSCNTWRRKVGNCSARSLHSVTRPCSG